jgi:hypothetical protein
MKLLVKFNLIFVGVVTVGIAISGWITRDLLQANAREEVQNNARLLMESASAVRGYTAGQITKLLQAQMQQEFLPQAVPSYSATEVQNALHAKYPEYAYKEATLNPTNPRDRAVGWEVDIVSHFRNAADLKEFVGQRDTPVGTRRCTWRGRCASPTRPACSATAAWRPRPRPWWPSTARPTASAGSSTRWWARRSCRCRWTCRWRVPSARSMCSSARWWGVRGGRPVAEPDDLEGGGAARHPAVGAGRPGQPG